MLASIDVMRGPVVLAMIVVGLILAATLVFALPGVPPAVIVNRTGGLPSDPNLIWCGSGPNAHPPCAENGISDRPSSAVPCHSGPDQIADCIEP